jgi:hypothetical protein
MKKVCTQQPSPGLQANCTSQAGGFSGMTAGFGKGFHRKSQESACNCIEKSKVPDYYTSFLTKFYKMHDLEESDDKIKEVIQGLVSKYKKKEGKLLFKLAKKFGVEKKFVRFDNIKAEL